MNVVEIVYEIQRYMKDHSINQAELARRTGLSQATVCRVFDGSRVANSYTIQKMLDGLNLELTLKEKETI